MHRIKVEIPRKLYSSTNLRRPIDGELGTLCTIIHEVIDGLGLGSRSWDVTWSVYEGGTALPIFITVETPDAMYYDERREFQRLLTLAGFDDGRVDEEVGDWPRKVTIISFPWENYIVPDTK